MKQAYFKIQLTLTLLLLWLPNAVNGAGKDRSVKPEVFLETSLSKEKVLEGERVIYEVRLFSKDQEIAGFELSESPDFDNLPWGRGAADNRLQQVKRDGTTYYSMVIDRFFIGADSVGTHKIKGGVYLIGYNRTLSADSRIWGHYTVNRVETLTLQAPDEKLQVATVPKKGRPEDFSGAIGSFDISVMLPEGELRAGEKAILVVTIEGKGDLTNIPAPDVRAAFREGLHFRSMTDNKEHFITKGVLGSEMELECVFTADAAGNYTILPITFTYYDTEKKRYQTISTKPLEIEVLPAKEKGGSPPVYHNI